MSAGEDFGLDVDDLEDTDRVLINYNNHTYAITGAELKLLMGRMLCDNYNQIEPIRMQ